jgi:cytochrome b6-f complex iron-sulfur subunit
MSSREHPPRRASTLVAPTRRAENILGAEGLAGLTTARTTRRGFFPWLGVAWVAVAAGFAVLGSICVRFLFPNVLFEPPSSFKAGYPSEYEVGLVDERFKSKFGVWIVRNESTIYALSTICTHLGCTPNWLAAEQKFKCPCHGSGFYKSGMNFEGPAPRPLERYKIYLADDGQIVVDKNFKYQFEKGQWTNPDSFIAT